MIINKLKISNFRNLKNIEINNSNNIKYILGNNGIGKSNTLEAINYFFTKSSFIEEDFNDVNLPIEIEISLILNDIELGYFDDMFDVDDSNIISIRAIQESPNDRIEYYHVDTSTAISYQKIRNLPCVYYNTINAPEELNFMKTKNSGKFLNTLIENYINENKINVEELVNSPKIDDISYHLNQILKLINFINNNDLSVNFEHNIIDLLPRLIELKDKDEMSVNKMGSGVRFSSYIYFELLNKIMQTVQNNSDSIIGTSDNKRYISIFVLLDEPEIHLHPYMQRSVINDIRNIINNEDQKFLQLIKQVFGLDGIFGQLIIVTHSPNIVSTNFHEIVRLDFYKGKVKAYTDYNCNFTEKDEKHFILQNDRIKEAFFAKSCILVEGPTERVVLPVFAKTMGINFDDYNIGIIQADGADSIPSLIKILNHYGIKTSAVMDKDKYDPSYNNVISTHYTFFEEEYLMKLLSNHRTHVLYSIISDVGQRKDLFIQNTQLSKVQKKINLSNVVISDYKLIDALKMNKCNQKILVLTTWLYGNKNTNFSISLANNTIKEDIPDVYFNIIRVAVANARK